jgi:hypothetical protein
VYRQFTPTRPKGQLSSPTNQQQRISSAEGTLLSIRLAADLAVVPMKVVENLVADGVISTQIIQKKTYVSLEAVQDAIARQPAGGVS